MKRFLCLCGIVFLSVMICSIGCGDSGGGDDPIFPLCNGGVCIKAPGPKIVFVTESRYDGNLGGLAGADAICQGEAEAAGLRGTFKAWLSDRDAGPATRFNKGDTSYVLAGTGDTIAGNWSDLTDGTIAVAISRTASGAVAPGDSPYPGYYWAWTNTNAFGTPAGPGVPHRDSCMDWSESIPHIAGLYGQYQERRTDTRGWTASPTGLVASCEQALRLYCFQQ